MIEPAKRDRNWCTALPPFGLWFQARVVTESGVVFTLPGATPSRSAEIPPMAYGLGVGRSPK